MVVWLIFTVRPSLSHRPMVYNLFGPLIPTQILHTSVWLCFPRPPTSKSRITDHYYTTSLLSLCFTVSTQLASVSRSRIRFLFWGRWPTRRPELMGHRNKGDTSHLAAGTDVMAGCLRDGLHSGDIIACLNMWWMSDRLEWGCGCIQRYMDGNDMIMQCDEIWKHTR